MVGVIGIYCQASWTVCYISINPTKQEDVMSDEQTNQQPDTSEPSPERQAELEAAYEKQKDNDAPYKGVRIRTLGELNWIMRQRRWSGGFIDIVDDTSYANLSGANLFNVNLSGANLILANFSGAFLDSANLSKANLFGANLSGATIANANFSGATLDRAFLDAVTTLDGIIIDSKTHILGVRWNGAPLDAIDWSQAPHLGDEPTPEDNVQRKTRRERADTYRDAQRAYHGLVVALRDQGLSESATNYRLREMAMQRKAAWYRRKFGVWLLNGSFGIIGGHGEKPLRAFISYTAVIASFAAIYWTITNFLRAHGQQPLQWYEAIVLSLSSFHGRGFFTNTINLGDPLAIVGALEAVMGLFIELIFIATFSRRFLGD
jgi:hypothetical protein